jgi:hypothetical protein
MRSAVQTWVILGVSRTQRVAVSPSRKIFSKCSRRNTQQASKGERSWINTIDLDVGPNHRDSASLFVAFDSEANLESVPYRSNEARQFFNPSLTDSHGYYCARIRFLCLIHRQKRSHSSVNHLDAIDQLRSKLIQSYQGENHHWKLLVRHVPSVGEQNTLLMRKLSMVPKATNFSRESYSDLGHKFNNLPYLTLSRLKMRIVRGDRSFALLPLLCNELLC